MGHERFPPVRTVLCLAVAVLSCPPVFARPAGGPAEPALERALKGALIFRQLALKDHRTALEACASETARERFAELDRTVWPESDPVVGWSFFVNTSIIAVASAEGPAPVIAFYHPYSDVFLLTSWEPSGDTAVMTDADVVIGDWVRNRAAPPFDVLPFWRRGETFAPAGLGRAVADSVRSLEEAFRGWAGGDWRGRLGNPPKGVSRAEVNRACAALMLARSFETIEKFASPKADEPAMLTSLRLELAFTLSDIERGGLEKTLGAADMTLPLMKSLLRQMPGESFKNLVVVATVVGSKDAVAIMAPMANADYCLSFYYSGTVDALNLRRIDVVYYPGWYKHAVEAGGAGRAGR